MPPAPQSPRRRNHDRRLQSCRDHLDQGVLDRPRQRCRGLALGVTSPGDVAAIDPRTTSAHPVAWEAGHCCALLASVARASILVDLSHPGPFSLRRRHRLTANMPRATMVAAVGRDAATLHAPHRVMGGRMARMREFPGAFRFPGGVQSLDRQLQPQPQLCLILRAHQSRNRLGTHPPFSGRGLSPSHVPNDIDAPPKRSNTSPSGPSRCLRTSNSANPWHHGA